MKKGQVYLSQHELLTIIALLELNEDNEDFSKEDRLEFSDLRNKLFEHLNLEGK